MASSRNVADNFGSEYRKVWDSVMNDMKSAKIGKIVDRKMIENVQNKSLRLAVLGFGYVGLTTAAQLANAGFQIIAVDIRPEVVKAVNSESALVRETGLDELVSRNATS